MSVSIPIAHDFICPWCWVGMVQANRLRSEFDVEIEWRGYELFPDELEWPDYAPPAPAPENKPPTPSRFEFILAADGMELPKSERPKKMRTHNAHEAVEFAKTVGMADRLIETLYKAYWVEGVNINDVETLVELSETILGKGTELRRAIEERRFKGNIVGFDDDAYASGVYNVPTFFIGGKRYAEQPYSVLKKAVDSLPERIYSSLVFPEAPEDRPYVYIDMVSTIDGKTLTGSRGESVSDLGSKLDHALMEALESSADAVLVGATTVKASGRGWKPKAGKKFVVTASGDLPFDSVFFEGDSYLIGPEELEVSVPGVGLIKSGRGKADLKDALRQIRALGVRKLLVLGGSHLNGQLIGQNLVDELFLTLAPKVKLGEDVPTYAGGEALPREQIQSYDLIGRQEVDGELFLRYRRRR